MYVHHAIAEVSQLNLKSKDKYYNKLAMKLNTPKTTVKPASTTTTIIRPLI